MELIAILLGLIVLVFGCAYLAVRSGHNAPSYMGRKDSGDWGEPIEMEIWGSWTAGGTAERIAVLTHGAVYSRQALPSQIHFRMTTKAKHDTAFFYVFSPGRAYDGWGSGPRKQSVPQYMEPQDGSGVEPLSGSYKAKGAILFDTVKVGMKVLHFTIQ